MIDETIDKLAEPIAGAVVEHTIQQGVAAHSDQVARRLSDQGLYETAEAFRRFGDSVRQAVLPAVQKLSKAMVEVCCEICEQETDLSRCIIRGARRGRPRDVRKVCGEASRIIRARSRTSGTTDTSDHDNGDDAQDAASVQVRQ